MNLTIIAATSTNRCIGKDGKIPWHLPNDFKRFKELTSGHTIIMGRKTFESLPGILPNRSHIVITRDKDYKSSKIGSEEKNSPIIITHSLEDALKLCPKDDESFIIGGEEIYKLGLEYANRIELTYVKGEFEGDAFFPEISLSKWKGNSMSRNPIDERHKQEYTYVTFERR